MQRSIRPKIRLALAVLIIASLAPVVGLAQRRPNAPRKANRNSVQGLAPDQTRNPPLNQGPNRTETARGRKAELQADGSDFPKRTPSRWELIGRALQTLDLTPEQRRSIRLVRDRIDPRMREFGRRYLDSNRQLEEILFGPTPDMERARTLAGDLAQVVGERTTARVQIELEVLQTLTPTQRAELRGRRQQMIDHMRENFRTRQQVRRSERRAERRNLKQAERRQQRPELDAPPEPMDDGDGPTDDTQDSMTQPGPSLEGDRRQPRGVELLKQIGATPEQGRRLLEVRRQYALPLGEVNRRFNETQRAIDDVLLADEIDAARAERLAAELGRIDAEREQLKFDVEAALRGILSADQYRLFWRLRRAPRTDQQPERDEERKLPRRPGLPPKP